MCECVMFSSHVAFRPFLVELPLHVAEAVDLWLVALQSRWHASRQHSSSSWLASLEIYSYDGVLDLPSVVVWRYKGCNLFCCDMRPCLFLAMHSKKNNCRFSLVGGLVLEPGNFMACADSPMSFGSWVFTPAFWGPRDSTHSKVVQVYTA